MLITRNKVGAASIVFVVALGVVGFASADSFVLSDLSPEGPKVTICHATNSENNPYNKIEVAQSAVDGTDGGHRNHTGPVWYQGAKADGVRWGDIIPPVDGVTTGLNWPAGQSTFNNGCELPGTTNEKTKPQGEKTKTQGPKSTTP